MPPTNNIESYNQDPTILGSAFHHDPTLNWTLHPPGPNIFGLYLPP